MPGRATMRLQNRATRTVLSLLTAVLMFALWTGAQSGSEAAPCVSSPERNGKQEAGKPTQEPRTSESGTFVFRKQVEEVVLHATVLDEKQRLVTTLDRGSFTVYED